MEGPTTAYSIGKGSSPETPPSPDDSIGRKVVGPTVFKWYLTGRKAISSDLSPENWVQFGIEAGEDSPVRGAQMFKAMMDHYGDSAKGVVGEWFYGDNFDKVNELTAAGLSIEEAASKTWTGKQAAKYGFTKVSLILAEGEPGSYTDIKVVFEKND